MLLNERRWTLHRLPAAHDCLLVWTHLHRLELMKVLVYRRIMRVLRSQTLVVAAGFIEHLVRRVMHRTDFRLLAHHRIRQRHLALPVEVVYDNVELRELRLVDFELLVLALDLLIQREREACEFGIIRRRARFNRLGTVSFRTFIHVIN